MRRSVILSMCLAWLSGLLVRADEPPKSLDPRLKIELFAEHPQIVTPTGLDVDHRGRVFAIESNTHFPPEGYKGHPTDRVLVMSDSDGDGKADKIVVFTDGLKFSMSVVVRPIWFPVRGEVRAERGEENKKKTSDLSSLSQLSPLSSHLYVATRREILLFHDDDGDDKADRKESIVHLDTKGDYPHNGLAGFAIDALGWMYFGFGENLGADYKIIGSDGTTLSGGGEGGNIYRCRLDGSKLSQIATGFWNPHASCFDAFGRLFTVDNDADSRPPCRLLHVIPGGDYGYRFRNGRKGLHPFTAWNGEIPGTLPMVAGTGEAPSGILAYESDGFLFAAAGADRSNQTSKENSSGSSDKPPPAAEEYLGNLLVTSWGDHRIDRFRLQPKGASFTSLAEPLITGGENFRPVGLATAPDGSLFCTDWVLRDYKLHGHGRIWRIAPKETSPRLPTDVSAVIFESDINRLTASLDSQRQPVRRAAVSRLRATKVGRERLADVVVDVKKSERTRSEALWALATLASDERPQRMFEALANDDLVCEAILALAADDVWKLPEGAVANAVVENWGRDPSVITKHARLAYFIAEAGLTWSRQQEFDSERSVYLNEFAITLLLANDPFLTHAAIRQIEEAIPRLDEVAESLKQLRNYRPKDKHRDVPRRSEAAMREYRLALAMAARKIEPKHRQTLLAVLEDPDPRVRRMAVQWAAEEGYRELKPLVATSFDLPNLNTELFLATIAALEMLDGKKPEDFDKTPAEQYVVPLLKDEKRSPAVRAQALRLVSPTDKSLDEPLFASLLKSDNEPLRLETVRTLQAAKPEIAGPLLRDVAEASRVGVNEEDRRTRDASTTLRAEAIVGLAAVAKSEPVGGPTRKLLRTFLKNSVERSLRLEALRAARPLIAEDAELRDGVLEIANSLILLADGRVANELSDQVALAFAEAKLDLPKSVKLMTNPKPKDRAEWLAQLNGGRDADPAAGRRVFFNPNGAGCFKCHIVDGRGGGVGPDLSRAVGTMNRDRLIQSILEPSREIAPQFVSWTFELKDGKVVTGMVVHENEGKTIVGNAEGQLIEIKTIDIETRTPQKISVMPEKLAERMTLQELRDVLAFLDSQR